MVLRYKEMFDICKDLYLDQYTLYFNSIAHFENNQFLSVSVHFANGHF